MLVSLQNLNMEAIYDKVTLISFKHYSSMKTKGLPDSYLGRNHAVHVNPINKSVHMLAFESLKQI